MANRLELPRKLGGDWENWDGTLEENQGDLETSPHYILSFLFLSLIMVCGMSVFLLFLIEPRLEAIHPFVSQSVQIGIYLFLALLILGYTSLVLMVYTEKPFAFFLKNREVSNLPFVSLAFFIGQKFGVSQDRLKNSLLKVSNAVTKALYTNVKPEELLILVPRCLSGMMRKEIDALTKKYGVTFHTASGGNKARELLITERPKAVIGVACERDLFSGIQDVDGQLPVLTIANKRPDGPCINTYINMDEMEKAIQFFLGRTS